MIIDSINGLFHRRENDARLLELWPKAFNLHHDGTRTATGKVIDEETALGMSAVFSCVNLIADSVAGLPLYLYKRVGRDGRDKARNHPVFKMLITRPNRDQTPFEFKHLITTQFCLSGNYYVEVQYNGRQEPTEVIALPPGRVDVKRNRETNSLDYKYVVPGGPPVDLDRARLIHGRGLSTDGVLGKSPIRLMREGVGIGLGLEEHQARFVENDATPRGILKTPAVIGKESKEKVRAEWKKIYGGVRNAHQIAVLDGQFDYQQIGLSLDDAQFIESRKFQLEEVARWYRVPAHMIGLLDRATNNNIEQQAREFLQNCLDAYLKRIEETFSMVLLKDWEQSIYFLEFDREKLFSTDTERMDNALGKRILTGQISLDEARAERNENPIPDGRGAVHLIPASHVPLDMLEDVIKAKTTQSKTSGNNDGGTNSGTNGETDAPQEDGTRSFANSVVTPFVREILRRHYRREGKEIAKKFKQCARRSGRAEFDQWYAEFMADAAARMKQDLEPVAATMAALDVADTDKLLREVVEYSTSWSELELSRAFKNQFEEALERFEKWDEDRADGVLAVFFT